MRSASAPIARGDRAIQVEDLTIAYREQPVVWDVDLEIPTGAMSAIIGPNGAGKSTLLKAILGLVPAAAGNVQIFGKPVARQRQRIAYVPQRGSVDWTFPTDALDVVTMGTYGKLGWFRRPGRSQKDRAMDALTQVGMQDFSDRQISQLSGGQQQRVFLARALVQDADLFVLDEPFAGVDAKTERAIIDLLHDLRSRGKTVLCVHHDLRTAPQYFDWVVMLNVRLIASGPMDTTFSDDTISRTYGHGFRAPTLSVMEGAFDEHLA